jgi:Transcription factor WhiB
MPLAAIDTAPAFPPFANHPGRNCAGADPELFFPPSGSHYAGEEAMRICHGRHRLDGEVCPVIGACLRWALQHAEHGVWGGVNQRKREEMRRAIRGVSRG